jgi:hypothetical protein
LAFEEQRSRAAGGFQNEGRPSACQDITTGFFRSKSNVGSTPAQSGQAATSGHGLVIRVVMQRVVKRLGLFEPRESAARMWWLCLSLFHRLDRRLLEFGLGHPKELGHQLRSNSLKQL